MRILVCVKRVPAPGARINITADGSFMSRWRTRVILSGLLSLFSCIAPQSAVRVPEAGDVTIFLHGYKGSFFRSNLHITAHRTGTGRNVREDILGIITRHAGDPPDTAGAMRTYTVTPVAGSCCTR